MTNIRYDLRNIKSVNYLANYLMWRWWYCNGKLVNFQYIWWFDNDDAKQVCELEGYGIPWHSYNTHLFVGRCSFVLIEVETLWRARNMKYRNTCHHQINIVNCQLEYNFQNMNNYMVLFLGIFTNISEHKILLRIEANCLVLNKIPGKSLIIWWSDYHNLMMIIVDHLMITIRWSSW